MSTQGHLLTRRFCLIALLLGAPPARSDGPADNTADKVRPVPPPGVEVPAADRSELEAGVADLGKSIDSLESALKAKPEAELVADVRIFHNAVRYALANNEIFDLKEIPAARNLLKLGKERAEQLAQGKAPWTEASGLVVRGYVSKIDGSVQPYGLVVPASFRPGSAHRHRVDAWFHGRGENLSELNFLSGRLQSAGEFTPRDSIVLHLYGRYCCANKLAGEIDLLEALDSLKRRYSIDEDRIAVRGFSMGGAACWQFAVHYAGLWAAAAPGAGFSETPDFLRVFQKESVSPPWWERSLWHLYDCTDYAINLFNCPTVAYSGEKDTQKQAADLMAKALKAEGIELVHVIGPGTGHSYHPQAKAEVNERIDAIVTAGRVQFPRQVKLTTWTLRYNRMRWITIDGIERHWKRARVDAEVAGPSDVRISTRGVTALTVDMPPGRGPLDITRKVSVRIDGQAVEGPSPLSDRSFRSSFVKVEKDWKLTTTPGVSAASTPTLRKRHGLQGPIDDAFLDSFVFVLPGGTAANEKASAWADAESKHAIDHWRKQFRGEARVVKDDAVTDELVRTSNLVLWGDPASNRTLAKIVDKLPIAWTPSEIRVGGKSYPAAGHALILIYPNPLNPERYVVLNSGFTFREYDYLNNARQVPKLPDWAVVDLSVPPSSRYPGKIAAAGFFGEAWELLADIPADGQGPAEE